ncbi:MAG: Rid family hydrolase [Planctomycetota bacterium]
MVARASFLLILAACATSQPPPRHHADKGALGPYSGSVTAGGFVFCSGKIGTQGRSFELEFETALDALQAELERSGLDLGDVVNVTVYLTDMERYRELNRIYARRFPEPYPARTTVAVASLPGGARVEIHAIAKNRADPRPADRR